MIQERINAFAKKQGYTSTEYLCEWHGYSCYEPVFDSNDSTKIKYVGLPLVVMVKGNEIRMSTADECLASGKPCECETSDNPRVRG